MKSSAMIDLGMIMMIVSLGMYWIGRDSGHQWIGWADIGVSVILTLRFLAKGG